MTSNLELSVNGEISIIGLIFMNSRYFAHKVPKKNSFSLYANNLTEHITNLANKHIPSKIIKMQKSDTSWLTNYIKRLIRVKKKR